MCGNRQVPPHAVRAKTEVPHRLKLAELDSLSLERLGDDRPRDVARVLPRPVVVEHARHDPGQSEGVVVVHRQEVGRHLRGRVHRLGIDWGTLVQDQSPCFVE